MPFKQDQAKVLTNDGRNFVFVEPLDYVASDGSVITIPAGATTDGASTPCALWVTIPPFGKYWLSAALHDYLYRTTQVPKERCDDLLYEAMLSEGVSVIEAKAIYDGVKLFGFSSFRGDRSVQPTPVPATPIAT